MASVSTELHSHVYWVHPARSATATTSTRSTPASARAAAVDLALAVSTHTLTNPDTVPGACPHGPGKAVSGNTSSKHAATVPNTAARSEHDGRLRLR